MLVLKYWFCEIFALLIVYFIILSAIVSMILVVRWKCNNFFANVLRKHPFIFLTIYLYTEHHSSSESPVFSLDCRKTLVKTSELWRQEVRGCLKHARGVKGGESSARLWTSVGIQSANWHRNCLIRGSLCGEREGRHETKVLMFLDLL